MVTAYNLIEDEIQYRGFCIRIYKQIEYGSVYYKATYLEVKESIFNINGETKEEIINKAKKEIDNLYLIKVKSVENIAHCLNNYIEEYSKWKDDYEYTKSEVNVKLLEFLIGRYISYRE